jgi:Resolvase, N terminal domain
MKYGYARVSTDGQSVGAQVRLLTKAGCKKVFRKVASGAKTDRAQLRRLLDQLEPGDVLTVTRLDRLARSTFDLFGIVKRIVDAEAQFDPRLNRGRHQHRALDAGCSRRLGRCRALSYPHPTAEGRSRAKAQGKHMGRPPSVTTPAQQKEATGRRAHGATCRN